MFGSRRHHRPNPPLTASTADPNAATAAAAVFKRHESNATLSAAAAAAALRARPMTPTRVADVQTKRTMRRNSSIASSGTASPIQGRPGLQRRGSSGSMTERTFRSPSPSPHRPGSSSGSGRRQSQSLNSDAPPVPALPKDVDTTIKRPGVPGAPQGTQHRKSNSLGMVTTPVRLASEKLNSEDAPSWFSAARLGDPANIRRTDPAMASPPSSPPQMAIRHEEPPEGGRPNSRASSINFSYPSRARVGSPPVSPIDVKESVDSPARISLGLPSMEEKPPAPAARSKQQPTRQPSISSPRTRSASTSSDQTLVYDPNSRRMVRQADLLGVRQGVVEPLQHSVGSKKKKKSAQRAGSHLAAGTMGRPKGDAFPDVTPGKAQNKGTALRTEESALASVIGDSHQEAEEPAVKAIISSPRIEAQKLEAKQRSDEAAKTPYGIEALPATTSSSWPGVRRQPSVVREESEPEDQVPGKRVQSPPVSPKGQSASTTKQKAHAETDPKIYINIQPPQQEHSPLRGPGRKLPDTCRPEGTVSPTMEPKRQVQVAHQRSHSNSPARQAHFGPVQDNLTVKHSPPPRSISPRKSALKYSSPSRGASLSDDTSEASLSVSHEPPVARKKSVRVSFDDNIIADTGDSGPALAPTTQPSISPQENSRPRWFNSFGRDKKDMPPLDDDEIMKPRPALPSFGSIRAKKPRDISPDETERPLVRPLGETAQSTPASASPGLLPSPPLGSSNDHAIGGIFSKDTQQAVKDSLGPSDSREPLPPVVTSVEGTGYFSDSSSSTASASDSEESETFHEVSDSEKQPLNGSATADAAPKKDTIDGPPIPVISVSQPTPPVVENKTLGQYSVEVPGRFPEDESASSGTSDSGDARAARSSIHLAGNLSNVDQQPAMSHLQPTHPATMEESSDSETSIYSDAYEDLSEINGDGFQSLNAVVETPLQAVPAPHVHTIQASAPPSADETQQAQREISRAVSAIESPPPQSPPPQSPEDEWEKVKAYWRNLSADKRAQLEREAIEDAGVEADLEEENPQPKPKKKKSIERRNSERKALALHMAQQMAAQSQPENPPAAERNYQIKPGTRWADEVVTAPSSVPTMRKSMRGAPPLQNSTPDTASGTQRLRKSMRGDRGSEPLSSPSQATASGHHQVPVQTSFLPTVLKRRDSSSSESSFKRSRPKVGGHVSGFRKSMRPNSPPLAQNETRPPTRISLRGPSPTETAPAGSQMRRTLRDSSTGRKSPTGIHLPGFGKKSSSKTSLPRPSSRFSSRFGNSSDDESYGSATEFRSRFDESSDDEPAMAVPSSIPQSRSAPTTTSFSRSLRNRGSIASTALPEELEESEESRSLEVAMNGTSKQPAALQEKTSTSSHPGLSVDTSLVSTHAGHGNIVSGSQTTPSLGAAETASSPTSGTFPSLATDEKRNSTTSRRHSLMSVLRRKKHDLSSGRISRVPPTESAARRDTKLERSEGELKNLRSQDVETPSPVVSTQNEAEDTAAAEIAATAVIERPQQQQQQQQLPAHKSPKLKKKTLQQQQQQQQEEEEQREQREQLQSPVTIPGDDDFLGDMEVKRAPTNSGNLGTRTLSGTFLQHNSNHHHQHHQQHRKTLSTGAPSVDGGSIAGSTSPTKKKRFGALRRMFKLDE